jgi:hypothetical protein
MHDAPAQGNVNIIVPPLLRREQLPLRPSSVGITWRGRGLTAMIELAVIGWMDSRQTSWT